MDEQLGIVMDPANIQNLEDLVQQVINNKCCAFIGAGISKEAGYPLWHEF